MRLIDADALWETIEKDRAESDMPKMWHKGIGYAIYHIIHAPTVNAVQVVRCKDCRYFYLDHFENFRGIPLIVAHEICNRWGNGCKTDSNGFCFMGERRSE